MKLEQVREEYLQEGLNQENLKPLPNHQFDIWMQQALDLSISYTNAASLATVDEQGFPSNRIILIKSLENDTLTFYSNYQSSKAKDIEVNDKVSICLFWKELDRQVRFKGIAKKCSVETSKEYFYSRPFLSQVSALVSDQSQSITKAELEAKFEKAKTQYKEKVPFPSNWGGYDITISEYEFWQGRPNRLHDRFRFFKEGKNWTCERLAP